MKKLNVYIIINLILAIIFSFLSLSFHLDISLLAFPIAIIFTVCMYFVSYKELCQKKSVKHIIAIRRFFQYEPFVFISTWVIQRAGKSAMPFVLDLIAALVWVAITVLSFMIQYKLADKRVFALSKNWTEYHKKYPFRKPKGTLRIFYELAEWIDALIQAVFVIILLNIFFFQLYEIPSESMVPTFLVKDRVIVFKTAAGPKFPLSDVGLPYIQNYKKGDIVVFRNPHYADDRKSEVKTFLSQFIYMCTLTLVKTNTDENGEIKADPLVKRIAALPGEQVIMMDGTLYYRTKGGEFKESLVDKKFAAWDLNNLSQNVKSKIQYIPMSSEDVEATLEIEQSRRELDLVSAALECERIAKEFKTFAKGLDFSSNEYLSLISQSDLTMPSPFYSIQKVYSNSGTLLGQYLDDDFINKTTRNLLSAQGGSQWFEHFLNDWHRNLENLETYTEDGSVVGENLVGGDLYTDSCFRLNVMTKLLFGRIVLRNAQLMSQGLSSSTWAEDSVRSENLSKAFKLTKYILYMDQRNMPLFPSNDENGNASYLPEDTYFMMGDNRYNSLDMRHSVEQKTVKLSDFDDMSIYYESNMAPQFVKKQKVLGKASYRFWPINRAGTPDSSR